MTASDFENLCNDIATARLVEENSNITYDDMFDGDKLKKEYQKVFNDFYDKAEEYYSKYINVSYD